MDYAISQLESGLYQAENNAAVHEAADRKERAEKCRKNAVEIKTAIEKLKAVNS